ncbi:MAG: metal ABC transporter permease [Planctomycetota bacterium]|nr:metal ABC transporter permease [Planctomycetota bacterium]
MSEFLDAAANYAFVQYALLAGVLASIACGIVGTYVVVRRITYIAGGISHCVLGGIGAALYFQRVHGWTWLSPLYGAIAAALAAAMIIGIVSLRAKQREDTVIGALWAIGMAVGVLFIAKTPGYSQDLMSYLFGNILMVSQQDLWLIAALDALVVALGLVFYNQFLAVCFDEEFARVRGMRVEFFYLLLLGLTALTVVLLVTVVGIVLVIALLTLPVAVAGHFARRLWQMMALAAVFSMLFTTAGLAISYQPDLPAGATVIVLAGAVYLVVVIGARLLRPRISS